MKKKQHPRIGFIAVAACLLIAAGCYRLVSEPSLKQRVAGAYGIESFAQVEALQYTFNVDLGDKQIQRSWLWEPQKDRVTLKPVDPDHASLSYERHQITPQSPEALRKVDAQFINDQYWLLFPLHLIWDQDAKITEEEGIAQMPIGGGLARLLTVRYPDQGGYTPGDVYELFIGPDHLIRQWIYRKAGASEPTRTTTWEEHRTFGPLVLSLNRLGPDGQFRVWFTDVALKLKGSQEWLQAEP